jgi:hypothetical protein
MDEHEDHYIAKVFWRAFALLLLAVILWKTFHTVEWRPNFDVNNVLCFRRSWWGLKEQMVVCEWRKDADPDREPNEGWCTKYSDGKWHIFYAEEVGKQVLYRPK